jgi:hypothetical protein
VYTVLVGKHQGKRLLGTPGHRWEENIQTDLTQITGKCGLDSSDTAQDQLWSKLSGRNRKLKIIK